MGLNVKHFTVSISAAFLVKIYFTDYMDYHNFKNSKNWYASLSE